MHGQLAHRHSSFPVAGLNNRPARTHAGWLRLTAKIRTLSLARLAHLIRRQRNLSSHPAHAPQILARSIPFLSPHRRRRQSAPPASPPWPSLRATMEGPTAQRRSILPRRQGQSILPSPWRSLPPRSVTPPMPSSFLPPPCCFSAHAPTHSDCVLRPPLLLCYCQRRCSICTGCHTAMAHGRESQTPPTRHHPKDQPPPH